VLAHSVTARGGEVSGDEEEGDEEGCQEKEVVSGNLRWGRHPPAALITLLFFMAFVKVSFNNFFSK
jgi:hypothetical protein